ncbi:MAG TPA: amidohydrolase family protein [Capsulimonadaceae bacterium]|jgi:5-methylthioadenosine/S-adenosylhomocysteine deaminase
MTQTYRARWILPVDAPPIENGEIVVDGGVIAAVRAASPGACDRDFGEAIIMPGFVNAHTHVEYTALRGFLEDVPFFPWVRALNASKAAFDIDDWTVSAQLGVMECVAGGITTIGDNTDAGVTTAVASNAGLRATVFQEVFGIDHREPVDAAMAALKAKIDTHRRAASPQVRVGVSPHAPYTVRPALFAALMPYAHAEHLPISIHVAESPAESELTERGTGLFAQMYSARGIEWTSPGATPTAYVASQRALTPSTLAVHCVHQSAADIAITVASGASIVHCPKSNAKLGAGIAPLANWLAVPGLNVALGTDSAVSNNTLDMFEEMRFALLLQRAASENAVAVTAQQVVEAATMGGAVAMGIDKLVGSLAAGKRADFICVSLNAAHSWPATNPYSALVHSCRADDVVLTVVDGQPLYRDGEWLTIDSDRVLASAARMRRKAPAVQP